MNNANQRLPGTQGTDHLFTNRLFLYRSNERLDSRQRHIGLEQRKADFAQSIRDVVLGQPRFTTKRLHYAGKALGQVIEHLVSCLV